MVVRKTRKQTIKPKNLWEKTNKKSDTSTLDRFENQEFYRNPHTDIGWTEDFCKHLDASASEDHTYVATWYERARYEKVWAINSNSHGHNTAPLQSRADYPEAIAKLRDMKERSNSSWIQI